MADLQNKGGMLRIKRKREEEAVPMLLVTKSSVKGTIPLKRRKQGDNCDKTNLECAYINRNQVFVLFKTLEAESVTKFEREHEKQTMQLEKQYNSIFLHELSREKQNFAIFLILLILQNIQ